MPNFEDTPRRLAILGAAYAVLMEQGYAGANTLEIARRAKVSKRELYAEFGNKAGILEALIAATAARMQVPLTVPDITSADAFATALAAYGVAALTELTSPHVIAINRLAVAEAGRSSDLGRILDQQGRESNRRALVALVGKAQAAGVLKGGDAGVIAGQFFALLTGDLLMRLLLGVIKRPRVKEIRRRAEMATDSVLRLHGV